MEELKKSVDIKVKQLEKGVASAGNEVNKLNEKFSQTTQELSNVEQQMDLVGDRVFETYKDFQNMMPEAEFDKFIQSQVESDAEYRKLINKQEQLKIKVDEYKTKLDTAKGKQTQLNTSLGQAKKEQTEVNLKLEEAKKKAAEYAEKMKNAAKNSRKTSVENLGIAKNLGGAVKKLAKFSIALLGFQGIYSLLKSSMNEWLNGSSKEAKQLQADIINIKANIGSALAPAIQSVLQIFYKMLAVVGAIVKAFANINIFAKNTAKSTSNTAKNSKQASNNLASFDSLDVLKKDDNSGGGSADVTPTDLSSLMKQYEGLAEKIKNIFAFIFEPFKKAWETTGQTVISAMYNAFNGIKNLCIAIGNSFAKIWTNGTAQRTVELLLNLYADLFNIIGNIANALANAWNNNNNGDKLVQALADAFNNLLYIVEQVVKCIADWTASTGFQNFLNGVIGIIATLGEWIKKITQWLKEIWDNGGKETFEKLLETLSKVGQAVTTVVGVVIQALTPVVDWILSTLKPVISGIIEAIGYVLDALSGLMDFIVGVFTGDWEMAWQGIKDFFSRNMECNKNNCINCMECDCVNSFISNRSIEKYNNKCIQCNKWIYC